MLARRRLLPFGSVVFVFVFVQAALSDAAIRGSGLGQDQVAAPDVLVGAEFERIGVDGIHTNEILMGQAAYFNHEGIGYEGENEEDNQRFLGEGIPSIESLSTQDPAGFPFDEGRHPHFYHRRTTFGYGSQIGPESKGLHAHAGGCVGPSDFFRAFHHDDRIGASHPIRHPMQHGMFHMSKHGHGFGPGPFNEKFGACSASPVGGESPYCSPIGEELFDSQHHDHRHGHPPIAFESFRFGRMGISEQSSENISDHIWLIEGRSFVQEGVKAGIRGPLGFVKIQAGNGSETTSVGVHYHLNNDIDFLLTPISDAEILDEQTDDANSVTERSQKRKTWKVDLTSKTTLQGTPMDLLIEKKLEDLFLGGEITTEYIEQMNFPKFIVSNGRNSSVQLIPLPRMFLPASTGSPLYHPEGEWVTVLGDKTTEDAVEVELSLIRVGGHDGFVLSIEGMNRHHGFALIKEDGSMTLFPISSTSLTPDNEELGKLENQMISILSQSTHAMVHPTISGPNEVTPTLIFSSPFSSVEFFRPEYSHHGHHEIPPSFWSWIPLSAKATDGDVSAIADRLTSSQVPVLLQLRKSGPASMLEIDVAASESSSMKLRALYLPTARKGRRSALRSVSVQPIPTEAGTAEAAEIQTFIQTVLNDFESIELDGNGSFLTLVGSNTSLSFAAAAVPSPGLWVMEPSLSHATDASALAALEGSKRPKLLVRREGSYFRGHLLSHGNEIHQFVIRNQAGSPADLDWRVAQLVKREVEGEETVIDSLFKDGVRVEIGSQLGQGLDLMSLTFIDGDDHITFVHPADLTRHLAGDWELLSAAKGGQQLASIRPSYFVENITLPVSMRLIPSGVGELVGEIHASQPVTLRMEEVFTVPDHGMDQEIEIASIDPVELDHFVTPTTWRFQAQRQGRLRSRSGRVMEEGAESENEFDETTPQKDQDALVDSISQCDPWNLQTAGVRITLRCGDMEAQFVKVLNRRIRHHVEGQWLVEFITLPPMISEEATEATEETEPVGVLALHHPGAVPVIIELKLQASLPEIQNHTGTEWDPMAITSYEGGIRVGRKNEDGAIGTKVGEFAMIVNPFGSIQIGQLNFVEKLEETIGGDDKSLKHLASVLSTLLKLIETNTPPMLLEVVHSELIITDGDSMLAMSRIPPFSRHFYHQDDGDDDEPAIQQGSADGMTESFSNYDAPVMLAKVRRRLEAVLVLEDLLTGAAAPTA